MTIEVHKVLEGYKMKLFCIKNGHLWITKPLIGLSLCANCGKLKEYQDYT